MTPEQLRAELARSQQQVADMAAAQEEFLRAVSHDLRAPLRHVTSYGTLVREVLGDLPPEVAQGAEVQEALGFLATMDQSARRMGLMIDGLQALVRASRAPLRLQPVPLADAVAQARKLQDMTLPRSNPYEQLDASGLLYALLYQQGQYAQAVLQTDRMMALAAAEGYDPTSRPWYKLAVEKRVAIATEPYVFASTKKLGITFARAFESHGVTGVVGGDITLEDVIAIVTRIQLRGDGYAFLATRDGKVVALWDIANPDKFTASPLRSD